MNTITINFADDVNIQDVYINLAKLYPNAKIVKNKNYTDDLLLAGESSLDFWNNDTDDEVWNNA